MKRKHIIIICVVVVILFMPLLLYIINVPIRMLKAYYAHNSDIRQLYSDNAEKFDHLTHSLDETEMWISTDEGTISPKLIFMNETTGEEGSIKDLSILSETDISFLIEIIRHGKFNSLYSEKTLIRLDYQHNVNSLPYIFLCYSSDGSDNSTSAYPWGSRAARVIWIAEKWYILYIFPAMA